MPIDSKLRASVINAIIGPMLEAEGRRLEKMLISLNQKNKEHLKINFDGFLYSGEYHLPRTIGGIIASNGKAALASPLWDDMEIYLRHKKTVYGDIQLVRQTISKIIDTCENEQNVRDALPEFLVDMVPELKNLSRIDEELYTIKDNARALRQYERIADKTAAYAVGRFMY